ncbi:MAG: outer membrane beta-barrel protein [Sphingobacteriales bacterium]|nr:outer membrane beta-barrel protein [Sphingobacteriales bacterium]MBI3719866.1 outer membrane beta-barrel protein [Sphingobacteriales bacterium]
MKKSMLIVLSVLIMSYAYSQGKVFIAAGYNAANISTTSNGSVDKAKMLSSFHAGIGGTFGISKVFDLETGLYVTGKGSKTETYFSQSTTDNYVKAKFNPFYLELPLYGNLNFPLEKKNSFFAGAGPYVAMGVFGKSKVETNFLGSTSTSTSNITFNNDDPTTSQQEDASFDKVRRFDFGFNFHAGFDLSDVILKVNYGLGLAKINSNGNNNADDKNKHRVFSVSVGIPLSK